MTIAFDKGELAGLIVNSYVNEFGMRCRAIVDELSVCCESPIEILIGAGLITMGRLAECPNAFVFCLPEDETKNPDKFLMMPQFPWGGFRIDWAFKVIDKYIFIECDGHEFHERTKEQAERDRARDRAVQAAGIPILRFTGREIVRDSAACILEIETMAGKLLHGTHP